jgi:glycosyltransferase involved in cell wall biosynthesis
VHDLDVRGMRAAGSRGRLASLVRETRPGVVHSHLFKADVLAASVVGRRRPGRAALVSTKHNVDVYLERPLWRAVGRAAARRADAVVAISDGVADFLRRTLAPRAPIDVIRYGIEPPRAPLAAPPRTGTVLCAARFEPQKDHATLLDAVEIAGRTRPLRVVLLGRGSLEPELRARAAALRGAEVTFAGFTDDPTPWYDRADAVALASRWEGLGLALVEAALRARPAVATAVGGIPEVVEDGVTGVLVPPGDPNALAGALRRVLDHDTAARMGAAAAARAGERFSVERCVRETAAVYERVLGAAR